MDDLPRRTAADGGCLDGEPSSDSAAELEVRERKDEEAGLEVASGVCIAA